MPLSRESLWAEHEEVIRRFEDGWGRGDRPTIENIVPESVGESRLLLAELVQIELEFLFRAGESPRVEPYLGRFPGLAADDDAVLDLIGSELNLRRRRGEAVEASELRRRFPRLASRLADMCAGEPAAEPTRPFRHESPRGVVRPTIAGFDIHEECGRGGMGVVYKASQPGLNRLVAVKTLPGPPGESAAARFRREAEAMARLDHPNIVPVYEVGSWDCGGAAVPFFAMKWYAGGTLDHRPEGPRPSFAERAALVEKISRAVSHAHKRGILHRDLKPSNILLDESGNPAVADFGLAGLFDPSDPSKHTAAVVGTPAYMAPEQARDPANVTTAVDVYGLGAILYHLLTGNPPVAGTVPLAVLDRLGKDSPDRPRRLDPNVPRDLETVCLKCLELRPDDRYASADALADDLARWARGEAIAARPPTAGERLRRFVRRYPTACGLGATALAAVGVAVVSLVVGNARIRAASGETAAALRREEQALYLERVASVGRLLRMNHVEQAWHTLDACPPPLRRWEWDYLDTVRRRLTSDDAFRPATGESSVAFLADGRIASADRDGRARVTDGTGREVVLPARGRVAARPGSAQVAVYDSSTLSLVDAATSAVVYARPCLGFAAFSADGKSLAVGRESGVAILDAATGAETAALPVKGRVVSGVFSPDGSALFVSTDDRHVARWEVAAKAETFRASRRAAVARLSVTADGSTLVEAMASAGMLTDAKTGRPRSGHVESSGPGMLLPVPGGVLVTASPQGEVVLRRADTSRAVRAYRGHVGPVRDAAVSADGRRLATAGEDGVRVWDLAASPEFDDLCSLERPWSVALSPDGGLAALPHRAASGPDGRFPVIETATGKVAYTALGAGDAAFDPKGRFLVTGTAASGLRVRDPATGGVLRSLETGSSPATRITFSPDGSRLAAVDLRGELHLWTVDDWAKSPTEITGATVPAWTPDGETLAVAAAGRMLLLDPAAGARRGVLSLNRRAVAAAFAPDAKTIAVAGVGRSLGLIDRATCDAVHEFFGNPSPVNALAFHPDGSRLATGGDDGFVRVWDVATGKELLALESGEQVFGVAWSPDGLSLYAAGPTLRRWRVSG